MMTDVTESAAQKPASVTALTAEFIGTGFLLAAIVGSGLMAADVAGGEPGAMLLANAVMTGVVLTVFIAMFADHSGAHFNPAVSFAMWLRGELPGRHVPAYFGVQIAGGTVGVAATNLMFGEPVISMAERARDGAALFGSEILATLGLVLVILLARRHGVIALAALVGLYIAAAIWFTPSTSFANPAVTIARMWTDSWVGIASGSIPSFIAAQFLGGGAAVLLFNRVFEKD